MAQNQHMQRWQQPVSETQRYPPSYSTDDLRAGPPVENWDGYGHWSQPARNSHNVRAGHDSGNARRHPQNQARQYPGYQETYQDGMDLQPPSALFQQPHTRSRSYNYDPRYHEQRQDGLNYANPPQHNRDYRVDGQRPGPVHSGRRVKPRERILAEPVSPKEMAWDSPFPTFNTKKKDHKKYHASLDKDMAKLDLAAQTTPDSFQGQTVKDETRPHISHGEGRSDNHFEDIGSPVVPPQLQNARRVATGPPNGHRIPSSFPAEHETVQSDYPDPDQHRGRRALTGQPNGQSLQSTYPTQSAIPPQQYGDGPVFDNLPSEATYYQPQPELPKFDAIPVTANERPNIHVRTSSQNHPAQAVYQKRSYQSPTAISPQSNAQDYGAFRGPAKEMQSPLADFAFDLPTNSFPHAVGAGDMRAQMPPQDFGRTHRPHPFNRQRPTPGVQEYAGAPQNFSSPPLQGANRFHAPPRSTSDNWQYPTAGVQGSRRDLNSQPAYQHPRPRTSDGRVVRHDHRADAYRGQENVYPGGTRREVGNGTGQPRLDRQAYLEGQWDPSQSVPSYLPTAPFTSDAQNPRATKLARPPPVRQYGNPASSENHERSLANNRSPDSTRAGLVPVRPGLMVNEGSNTLNQSEHYTSMQPDPSPGNHGYDASQSSVTEPPVTAAELSSLSQTVKNNPSDHALGLKFVKKLVEAASVLSNENGKADQKTTAKNRERYVLAAHKQVKKLVNANYPDAMFYLADCYGEGRLGLAPDPKEAFHLYQTAAKLNHAPAAYRVAVCCEMGQEQGGGTRRDVNKATHWYKRAATLGDTPAMYKLGMILLKGLLSQQRNPREALSWLKRAAERADTENPHALHELGLLYENATPTDNIIKDESYALSLFHQAAELGYKYSQFRLGFAYETGLLGCSINPRRSIGWYSKAATQGEHQSELALSGWYFTGSEPILPQNDAEAYLWARKAAASGLPKAEFAMGYFNELGIGTPVDLEEAKRWYYRAAAQNFQKARDRLEDLKKGGGRMQKTRVTRSSLNRQNDSDCRVM